MTSITVKELIEELKKYPETAQVYMAKDEEGNGFSTFSEESIEFGVFDEVVALFPIREHLDFDDVFPKEYEREYNSDERSVD